MKSRPSEFTPAMLAAHTPDAVPNHPGSTNDQHAANVPTFPLCVPCTPPTWFRLALTFPSDYATPSRSN